MRLTKILVSAMAVGVATLAFATTSSQAAGDEALVNVTCSGGAVTAKGVAPWHTNEAAPWKWDKGEKQSVTKEAATFKGAKCEGTLKAYVCNGDQCKGPIAIPVK
jgi:hypothetical protein